LLQNRGFAKWHRAGHMSQAVRHQQNRRSRSAENGRETAPGRRISQNLDFAAGAAAARRGERGDPVPTGRRRGHRHHLNDEAALPRKPAAEPGTENLGVSTGMTSSFRLA